MIVENAPSGLSLRAKRCRLALWIVLLLLTAVILLFPIHLRYEYHTLDSLYIFGDKLLLFGILFSLWMASLLSLIFLFKGKRDEWEKLALLCVFTVVFVSFWILITPFGRYADEVDNLSLVKYLQDTPKLDPNLGYLNFPGIHITGVSLVEVTGLGIFTMRTIFVVLLSLLFTMLLYVLCLKSLKSTRLASLAVLIMVQGNLLLARQPTFWPGALSLIFFLTLFILLYRHAQSPFESRVANTLLMMITFAALTVSYLLTPVYFIFILLAVFIMQKMTKKNLAAFGVIVLFVVLFFSWQEYWAVNMFKGWVGWGANFVQELKSGGLEEHLLFLRQADTQLGSGVPSWVSWTRLFWLFITYVVGGILVIANLTRVKKLSLVEIIETGGLLGVIILSIIIQLLAAGGAQFHRILMYSQFFTVPIALRFFSRLVAPGETVTGTSPSHPFAGWLQSRLKSGRQPALALGLVFLLVLGLPTWLSNHDVDSTYNVYSYEYADGEFLSSFFSKGEGLTVFANALTIAPLEYSMPLAGYQGKNPFESVTNEDILWKQQSELVNVFLQEGSRTPNWVFVLAEKHTFTGWRLFGIEPTDPKWVALENQLSDIDNKYIISKIYTGKPEDTLASVNLIYANGHSQMFK
jgi:hypothetical protein